jgi:hypothetical protein
VIDGLGPANPGGFAGVENPDKSWRVSLTGGPTAGGQVTAGDRWSFPAALGIS